MLIYENFFELSADGDGVAAVEEVLVSVIVPCGEILFPILLNGESF